MPRAYRTPVRVSIHAFEIYSSRQGLTITEQVFNIMNMGSIADLSTYARIRTEALALFGSKGFRATTVRDIAAAAEVSPGLVIHHFGSKAGLQEAVDTWLYDYISAEENIGLLADLSSTLRYVDEHPELQAIMDYLLTCLREGGERASRLFDRFVEITAGFSAVAVEQGLMKPSADAHARDVLMVAYNCGVTLLARDLARHLGGSTLTDPDVYARYNVASLEILAHGVLTDAALQHAPTK